MTAQDIPFPIPLLGSWRPVDAVGAGLNSLDHRIVLPGFPTRDGRTMILEEFRTVGGQAAVAMATVARLGGRARYLGTFGDDAEGAAVRTRLGEFGVDVSRAAVVSGVPNQHAIILVESEGGTRTILWSRDERLEVPADQVRSEDVADARALLLDNHDLPARLRAARLARQAGTIVVLDAENVRPGTSELVAETDVVLADRDFPARFTGIADRRASLEAIRALGPRLVGMTLGEEGSLLLGGDEMVIEPSIPVEALDTTGAGDVYHGAFVYAMLQGWSVRRVLRFANVCAALAIRRRGGPERVPDLTEVLALIDPC